MKILALDTSSKYLSLALAQDNRVLAQMHRALDRRHSTQLVCLIEQILAKCRLSLQQLDGFCLSKGPGSFTGLRIGITTIKALAFALEKPVVAIPSLDILAQNARAVFKQRLLRQDKMITVCTIVDARQNKVYACLYKINNGQLRRKSAYLLLPFEQLLRKLKGEILFLGDAISLYRHRISQRKKISPLFASEKFCYPRARAAVSLALMRFHTGKIDDVNKLKPLYLYPKECQIK